MIEIRMIRPANQRLDRSSGASIEKIGPSDPDYRSGWVLASLQTWFYDPMLGANQKEVLAAASGVVGWAIARL